MGSSYTWCNFYKVTPFLHHRFIKDLTAKKIIIKYYWFSPHSYLILPFSLSPYLLFFTGLKRILPFLTACFP